MTSPIPKAFRTGNCFMRRAPHQGFTSKLPVRLPEIARNFRDQLVWADSADQSVWFAKNKTANDWRSGVGARVIGDIEVSFIERERFHSGVKR